VKYLLAISGGRDSMALLAWMADRYDSNQLAIVHFNHRQRGVASTGDERFVRKAARRLELDCWVARGSSGSKSEAALRAERWKYFRSVQKSTGSEWIVTAHTLDDQLETFFLRLMRGTGLDGLPGMKKKENGVWRPFLQRRRDSLPLVEYREDASNATLAFFRNRIRHRLLPELYRLAQPHGGKDGFLRRFSTLNQELHWARDLVRKREKKEIHRKVIETPFFFRVATKDWSELSRPWQRRLIRHIATKLGVTDLGVEETERIRRALSGSKRRGDIGRGFSFEQSCGQIYFPRASDTPRLEVRPGKGSYRVRCAALGWEVEIQGKPDGEWRFFRAGDRTEKEKLKSLFLTRRIPSPERRLLPLWSETSGPRVKWFYPQENPRVKVLRAEFPFSFEIQR